jgi:hypothetical protein
VRAAGRGASPRLARDGASSLGGEAALVLAAVGALPFALALPQSVPAGLSVLARMVPVVARSAVALLRGPGASERILWVSVASLLVMVFAVVAVARLTPRVSNEGVLR